MSKIPIRFEDASPADWDHQHDAKKLMNIYFGGIDEFIETGVAPVIAGPTGSGKSRAAAAILKVVAENSDLSTEWFSASDTFNLVADLKDMRSGESYFHLWNNLLHTDVIVLDDITALRNTPRLREYLWMVINHRYEERKSTIITVNSSKSSMNEVLIELAQWCTSSIARRIKDCSTLVFAIF